LPSPFGFSLVCSHLKSGGTSLSPDPVNLGRYVVSGLCIGSGVKFLESGIE